ncbi:MAG: cytochrome c3 family protein [Thermodesulfobacteriota bacterium]
MRATMATGAILGTLLLAACGAHTKREWLTFFFDGVPPEKTESPAGAGQPVASAPPKAAPAAFPAAKAAPEKVVHPPYRDRRCDACHESKFSHKLRGKTGEICLLCHRNLFAEAKFRHAPAEDGSCLGCHNPHESAEKHLLTRKGQHVCRECHDEKDLASAPAHAASGTALCQACHDPHGGGNRLFIKTGAPRAPADFPAPAAR